MEEIDKKTERAKDKFNIVNQWITNCDAKSSILLAFYGVLLTVVFSSELSNEISKIFSSKFILVGIGYTELLSFLSGVSFVSFIVCSILCLFFIYNTLKARINDDIYSQPELNNNSNIFFLKISKKTYSDFKNSSNNELPEDFLNDLNSQIFINSNIATEKFKSYNRSLLWGFMGMLSIGIYQLII
jgi:hypothetical protein